MQTGHRLSCGCRSPAVPAPAWNAVQLLLDDRKLLHHNQTICQRRDLIGGSNSLCIELGYSALLVAKRLGDTVPVVMKTYAHLYPNKQAELVSKLEDLAAPENEDSGYLGSL